MVASADLHLHTVASDGTWQPAELVLAAKNAGLTVIAITDHDTTGSVESAQAYGRELGITVIPGVELSSRIDSFEIHLLGLGIDPTDVALQATMVEMRGDRAGRAKLMVQKLTMLGAPIQYARVCEIAGDAAVGRPHVARTLVEAGHVTNLSEAFERYLGEGRPAYVERAKVTPAAAIDAIHAAGGVAVCAHPGLLPSQDILPELVANELDGLEAYHSSQTPEQTRYYLSLAKQWNLLISGGSDCHGPGMHSSVLLGSIRLDLASVQALIDACERYRP